MIQEHIQERLVRFRLRTILSQAPGLVTAPETLRSLRAIEVLEHIATPEARQLLARLADGAPGAWQTREAKAALERLERKPAGAR